MGVDIVCAMCGRKVTVPNRHFKFCPACRKARKKIFDANAMQTFRAKAREQRKAVYIENQALKEENRLLLEENARLKEVIRNECFNCM